MSRELKIGIVGAGAIGRTLALFLTSKGFNVEITAKKSDNIVIDNRLNIDIYGEFGDRSVLVPFVTNYNFTSKKDIMFLVTKSGSITKSLKSALKHLSPDGIVVGVQNVLNLEEIFQYIPKNKYVSWIIHWNALRVYDKRIVIVNKSGDNHIGVFNDKAKVFLPIVKNILDSISPTYIEDDMMDFVLSKFVLSSLSSCLGALTGYSISKVLQEKAGKKLFLNVMKEQIAVFENVLGHEVSPYYDILDYYKFIDDGISGIIYRSSMFRRLINQNHNTVSPVLRDLEYNQPTELDCLIKKVVKIANDRGVYVPYCTQFAYILDQIAKHERSIIMDNLYDERLQDPEKFMKM